ncbi:hypothetical protein [Xanthomonas campestris]|uniref:hypothetical protein n=1 Tax=Xanthomonas campestris TaxID=339 RepID=UPI00388DD75F
MLLPAANCGVRVGGDTYGDVADARYFSREFRKRSATLRCVADVASTWQCFFRRELHGRAGNKHLIVQNADGAIVLRVAAAGLRKRSVNHDGCIRRFVRYLF